MMLDHGSSEISKIQQKSTHKKFDRLNFIKIKNFSL